MNNGVIAQFVFFLLSVKGLLVYGGRGKEKSYSG